VKEPRQPAVTPPPSLDEAIRIALVNAKVVRLLPTLTATTSGRTIYDTAITNTTIDQEQARFDPVVSHKSAFNRTENPVALFDPRHPTASFITGTRIDDYRADTGVQRTNARGGQWSV